MCGVCVLFWKRQKIHIIIQLWMPYGARHTHPFIDTRNCVPISRVHNTQHNQRHSCEFELGNNFFLSTQKQKRMKIKMALEPLIEMGAIDDKLNIYKLNRIDTKKKINCGKMKPLCLRIVWLDSLIRGTGTHEAPPFTHSAKFYNFFIFFYCEFLVMQCYCLNGVVVHINFALIYLCTQKKIKANNRFAIKFNCHRGFFTQSTINIRGKRNYNRASTKYYCVSSSTRFAIHLSTEF